MAPRYYQISVLAGLLIYGLAVLDFEISLPQVAVTMAGALLTQWDCSRLWNDYEGEPKDFAVVIPVPTVIKKEAEQVVEMKAIDHVDAYSAPRLVGYFDGDPCQSVMCKEG